MRNIFYKCMQALLPALLLFLPAACADDMGVEDRGKTEGYAYNVQVNLSLPEMQQFTRSNISDEEARSVNNLWLGVFDSQSGKLVYSDFWNENKRPPHHVPQTLTIDKLKAGYYRLAAVANSRSNQGVTADGTKGDLYTLLQGVTTWDEYRALGAVRSEAGAVDPIQHNILMSGLYYEENNTDGYEAVGNWEDYDGGEVLIPAGTPGQSVSLNGHIHLRRVISQVKFEIRYAGDVIEVEPYYWRVHNLPEVTWVQERNTSTELYGTRNAGDRIPLHGDNLKANYASSMGYDGTNNFQQQVDKATNIPYYTFDFWQFENKRNGQLPEDKRTYEERERYEKHPVDSVNVGMPDGSYRFTALSDADQQAGYVEVRANVTYKEKIKVPGQSEGTEVEAVRTADVTYLVHLGYIEGGADKANDFVCRRNSIYTYRMTVNGVHSVYVEGNKGGEFQPGAYGYVTDVTNEPINLDAHYHAFNIQLSNMERTGQTSSIGEQRMPFIIDAYDGNNNLQRITAENADAINAKYWQWIELRPTSGPDVLAPYKAHGTEGSNTFYLTETGDLANFPPYDGNTDPKDAKLQWYTVFVNEYVYETSADETGKAAWKEYVNKSPRTFWMIVNYNHSYDGQSVYSRSKYVIRQKSIQTFFSVDGDATRALGVEHFSESLGLNLRWMEALNGGTSSLKRDDKSLTDYGRFNTWQYLSQKDTQSPQWDDFVNQSVPFSCPPITRQGGMDGYTAYLPELTYKKDITENTNDFWKYDPFGNEDEARRYIDVLNACTNRNRDNNGNGIIDPEEVRWYVPSYRQIVGIIVGRNSLVTPVMEHPENKKLAHSTGAGGNNGETMYHIATSDGQILWADEGLSMSQFLNGNGTNARGGWNVGAWRVRCVRDLGRDQSHKPVGDADLVRAYNYVSDGDRTFVVLNNYDKASVRTEMFYTSIPSHHIYNQQYNRAYRQFEVAGQDVHLDDTQASSPANWTNELDSYTDFCKELNDARAPGDATYWRVPNQKEMVMMWRMGLIKGYGGHEYLSSTFEYFNKDSGAGTEVNTGNNRYMGIGYGNYPYAVNTITDAKYVRCVRDVPASELP